MSEWKGCRLGDVAEVQTGPFSSQLYDVEVKRLNEQVKSNIKRFPQECGFQLTAEENSALRSHFVTLEESKALKPQCATSSWVYHFAHL